MSFFESTVLLVTIKDLEHRFLSLFIFPWFPCCFPRFPVVFPFFPRLARRFPRLVPAPRLGGLPPFAALSAGPGTRSLHAAQRAEDGELVGAGAGAGGARGWGEGFSLGFMFG